MQYGFDCDAQLILQGVSKVQVFPLDGHNTKQGEYGGLFGGIKTIGHWIFLLDKFIVAQLDRLIKEKRKKKKEKK